MALQTPNIADVVVTSNTFNDWIASHNVTSNGVDTIFNGNFLKEQGNFNVNTAMVLTNNATLVLEKTTGYGLNVAANVKASGNVEVGNQLFVATKNVLNEIVLSSANSANMTRVSANSGSTIAKANGINFVNTATIQVSVTAGVAGNANVSFVNLGGNQGNQGFQGTQGAAGAAGAQGATGTAGPQGSQGRQGNQGFTGSGSQGNQGVQGTQGTSGSSAVGSAAATRVAYYDSTTSVTGTAGFTFSGGTVTATDFAATSDVTLKDVIGRVDFPLIKLKQIDGVYFFWNDTAKALSPDYSEKRNIGVLAQQVEWAVPEAVMTIDGIKRVQYDKLVPLLIEAIRELEERVKLLEGK